MRFYTKQHRYYCGIDLHARSMYVCILDQQGEILLHRNMPCAPELFLKALAPYREDMVVAVECIFTWYWLADLCAKHNIPFVLGHALYMKAIHGGKAKNDKIDAHKIAVLQAGTGLEVAGPSNLFLRVIATIASLLGTFALVLALAAWFLLKVVIGFIAAVAWVVAVVVALIAVVWAARTLF